MYDIENKFKFASNKSYLIEYLAFEMHEREREREKERKREREIFNPISVCVLWVNRRVLNTTLHFIFSNGKLF